MSTKNLKRLTRFKCDFGRSDYLSSLKETGNEVPFQNRFDRCADRVFCRNGHGAGKVLQISAFSRLTKEVDPQYRLSPAQAAIRCNQIALRVAKLSKLAVGNDSGERTETIEIYADGTSAIDNPYGTGGAESLVFSDGVIRVVKFLVASMVITYQPASVTIVSDGNE